MTAVEYSMLTLTHDRREMWRVTQVGLIVGGALAGKMPDLSISPFRMKREAPVDDDALENAIRAFAKGHNARRKKRG